MSKSTHIELHEASEGMVLAADLLDASSTVLLPAGATLTGSMLDALARRGIASLAIVTEESNEQRQAERERQCARLAVLFRHSAGTDVATDAATNAANADASAILLERLLHYRRTQ